MRVCSKCFSDKEIQGYINSFHNKGKCDICNSIDVLSIEVSELLDFFQELIDNFIIVEVGQSLQTKIQDKWIFFASNDIAASILNAILPLLSTDIQNSDEFVDYAQDITANLAHWQDLKEKLKWERRFISDIDYLVELGWDGFFNTQYELKPETELFRARVHHESNLPAYDKSKMKTPEPKYVNGGRANPSGIPFLYLSDNTETVLYEVRASYLDELSIATFKLMANIESIKIVDFTEVTSLFQPNSINSTIKAKLLRDEISRDLSKPMRRYDTEIEYIPTQFICEFIKVFTGASGIRFYSSLDITGKNIVIFDQDIMDCEEVSLRKINNMNLGAINL